MNVTKKNSKNGENSKLMFPRGLELPASIRNAHVQPSRDVRPYIGHANPKTGTSGGGVSWRDLSDAGISIGQPFLLLKGKIIPMSGVPCLLLGAKLVVELANKGTHKREGMVVIASTDEVEDIEYSQQQYLRCAWHALVLACGVGNEDGVVASYSERLAEAVDYRSAAIGPWLAAIQDSQTPAWAAKNAQAAGLPPLVRVHARIAGAVKTSRVGNEYVVPRTLVSPTTDVRTLDLIAAALQAVDVESEIEAWERYYGSVDTSASPNPDDKVPF